MRKFLILFTLCWFFNISAQETTRIQQIQNSLELLALDNPELNEDLKLEINVANVTLPNFLIAVSKVHGLNLTVSPDIGNITIVNNFSDVTVADLLVYLCKEYGLDIEFTGNILSIKKYIPPMVEPKEKEILVDFDPNDRLISMDLKNDPLERVFRKIMDLSQENLLFANGMENLPLTLHLKDVPFDTAMEKLAAMNGLSHSISRDGFYLFSTPDGLGIEGKRSISFGNSANYQVRDTLRRILDVDFKNTPVATFINGLTYDLNLDTYIVTPLEQAGKVTFNAKGIGFDQLLEHIFEGRETNGQPIAAPIPGNRLQTDVQVGGSKMGGDSHFTFKKENNIYFFGTSDQLSLRKVEVVQMMHRSVELLSDPESFPGGSRSTGRTQSTNINYYDTNNQQGSQQFGQQSRNNERRSISTNTGNFGAYKNGAEALINILPDEIKTDLDIRVDTELNSFLVSGPSSHIDRFKKFIKEIDKAVPVVLIEVMIIAVNKSASVETGISWGIGDSPVTTQGKLFPTTDATVGASTINKILGGFTGFGSFNIGQVIPEFFANIKLMEESGIIKIKSTPRLSTLNGHKASLSIGETTYYVVTSQSYFGSQNPIPTEVRNYAPIDAELAISIKPLVSGDGQVTLDISVVQSDFSGERIENDAPPNITSREFSSIIRMQNQDLAILGGLEEKMKNDRGSGVPLLARIPIIKWLFSERKREDEQKKLTILIKPTVIY